MSASWYEWQNNELLLRIVVQPKASKDEIIAPQGDRLKIKVKALPTDGEANRQLVKFLAKTFKTAKSNIVILQGESSRLKLLHIKSPGQWPAIIERK